MRTLTLVLLSIAAVAQASEAPRPEVSDLGWIAGSWCSATETATAEEHWIPPHGGVILGVHRDVREGRGAFFEYLRIVEEDGKIIYFASPAGRPATPFELVELEEGRAVFENPDHDFPQRVVYTLSEGGLEARIEGEIDGETKGSVWRWTAEGCGFLEDRQP